MPLMATRCLLGKRKNRPNNHEVFLLDPDCDRSHHGSSSNGRGKQLVKTIASMLGFGRKKKKKGYEELEKKVVDMPFQWVGFVEEEKSQGESEDSMEDLEQQGKKKRPRLEELLGWNLKLSEKDEM